MRRFANALIEWGFTLCLFGFVGLALSGTFVFFAAPSKVLIIFALTILFLGSAVDSYPTCMTGSLGAKQGGEFIFTVGFFMVSFGVVGRGFFPDLLVFSPPRVGQEYNSFEGIGFWLTLAGYALKKVFGRKRRH